MAHEIRDSGDRNFEYPPVPNGYTNSVYPPVPSVYTDSVYPPAPSVYTDSAYQPVPSAYTDPVYPQVPSVFTDSVYRPVPNVYTDSVYPPVSNVYTDSVYRPVPNVYTNSFYPPVPKVYTNSVSTFGGLQGSALMEDTEREPSRYPYYGHYATASFTPSPRDFSYLNNFDENAPTQNAPVNPPALSSNYSHLAPLTSNGNDLLPRDAMKTTTTARKYGPRGTTGSVVCPGCGNKFATKGSLRRHSKICRGEKPSRKQTLAQPKSIETKSVGFHSQSNTGAMSMTEVQPNQQDSKDQDDGYNGTLGNILGTNMMFESQGPSKASSTSNLTTLIPHHQRFLAAQPYVPLGPDTFAGHAGFRCDICPEVLESRYALQKHKTQVHGVIEYPFMPDSGTVTIPPYLEGLNLEKSSKHSTLAFRIFQGGALSSSPCQPCISRGLDCIVSPFISIKCSLCAYNDHGDYCGAAGVKYSKPRGLVDDRRVTTSNPTSFTQPMMQRSEQAAPEASHPGVPSRSNETQHGSSALIGHIVSASPERPEPSYHTFSN